MNAFLVLIQNKFLGEGVRETDFLNRFKFLSQVSIMKRWAFFDIDLTLVNEAAGDLHLKSFNYALGETLGIKVDIKKEFDHSGKTDLGLLKEVAAKYGMGEKFQGKVVDEAIDFTCNFFQENIGKTPIKLMPGAKNVLGYLKNHTSTAVGVVTGNSERIALAKLDVLGVKNYFLLGGYGDRFEKRVDIVKDALRKATEFGMKHFDTQDIDAYIIDDTPRGMEAAIGAHAKCIAVKSGKYKNDSDFLKYNTVAILNSLEEVEKIKSIFPSRM